MCWLVCMQAGAAPAGRGQQPHRACLDPLRGRSSCRRLIAAAPCPTKVLPILMPEKLFVALIKATTSFVGGFCTLAFSSTDNPLAKRNPCLVSWTLIQSYNQHVSKPSPHDAQTISKQDATSVAASRGRGRVGRKAGGPQLCRRTLDDPTWQPTGRRADPGGADPTSAT